MKHRRFKKILSIVLTFSLVVSMIGTMMVNMSAHEVNSKTKARWITVKLDPPKTGFTCILRFGAHSSATSKLIMAFPAAITRWRNNSNNKITDETGTTNVMLASTSNLPPNAPQAAVAYTTLRSGSVWLNTITDDNIRPGEFHCNYAEIWSFPSFEGSSADRSSIVTHEIGHVVGLGHTSPADMPSVMQSNNIKTGFKTTPQNHDREDLKKFYS